MCSCQELNFLYNLCFFNALDIPTYSFHEKTDIGIAPSSGHMDICEIIKDIRHANSLHKTFWDHVRSFLSLKRLGRGKILKGIYTFPQIQELKQKHKEI